MIVRKGMLRKLLLYICLFQAMDFLQHISDGSLDNIAFPMENEFTNVKGIKQEPQNFALDESEFDAANFVETEMVQHYPDVKLGIVKKSKIIKRTNLKNSENEEENKLKPFTCKICGKGYISSIGIQNHMAIVHEGKKSVSVEKEEKLHKCELCDKSYKLNNTLVKHVQNAHKETTISNCHLCCMKFPSKDKLQNHIKVKHELILNVSSRKYKKFKCDSCDKRCYSEKDLNLHTAVVHEGLKPFACDLCPMKYTAKNSLQHHVILQHELKDQGINETNFHEHNDNPKVAEILRRKSETLKKTVCKFCDKTLEGGMAGRATHMRESHCDESGNFKCPQCELNFRKYELRWLPFSLYLL